MTVKELIELLQKCDQEKNVRMSDTYEDYEFGVYETEDEVILE